MSLQLRLVLADAGVRNSTGAIGPEVLVVVSNASSYRSPPCGMNNAGSPDCLYEFTVLGHWASAAAAPQWLEWDFSLRPGMGIGRVQALQFPAADGDVEHQLLFDGAVVASWQRTVSVNESSVVSPEYCQIVFGAVQDCADVTNGSTCSSNPSVSCYRCVAVLYDTILVS
jgi:hypothetical protein